MISIKDLHKRFTTKTAEVNAVDGVSLEIADGQIYGIMGYSGAGKSTLVRCINFLELPDSGSIEISGFGKVISEGGRMFLERDGSRSPMSEK
ncbi:MAG: ATP-binding cassette domain-containing protein, partial [Firmicutes bacterium]|nr:ATP-binding cassette domain-containing protein [Bacillota bacterium]